MLGLKLNHVSKRGLWIRLVLNYMPLSFIKTTSIVNFGWHENYLLLLATLDVMELNWLRNYFPVAGLIDFRGWNCTLLPQNMNRSQHWQYDVMYMTYLYRYKLCKLLIKISLNQEINIKYAIISGVPDLGDIFANKMITWCRKLMFGYGSANFRICEYKYNEKNRSRQNPSR